MKPKPYYASYTKAGEGPLSTTSSKEVPLSTAPTTVYPPLTLASLTALGIPLPVAAQLTAENWTKLGNAARARQCGYWMWGGLALYGMYFAMAALGLPLGFTSGGVLLVGSVAGWYYHQIRPQAKVLRNWRDHQGQPVNVSRGNLIGIWFLCFIFIGGGLPLIITAILPKDAVMFETWLSRSPTQRAYARYTASIQAVVEAEQKAVAAYQATLERLPSLARTQNANGQATIASELRAGAIPLSEACLAMAERIPPDSGEIKILHMEYITALRARLEGMRLIAQALEVNSTEMAKLGQAKLREAMQHGEEFNRMAGQLANASR